MGPSLLSRCVVPRGCRVALAALLAVVAACSSGLRVATDFDPTADLSGYRTYQWAERSGLGRDDPRVYDDLVAARLRSVVDSVLAAKGFSQAATEPDFLVGWHGAIDGRMSVTSMRGYYPYGWGFYGPPYEGRWGGAGMRVDYWEEGTVLIDVVDAEWGELVWRGSATARLREVKDDGRRRAIVTEAVAAILRDFPPGGGR